MPITSLTAVKTHLGSDITAKASNTLLSQLIAQCESAVEKYTKRQITQKTITEFYSGTGTNTLFLRKTPARSIVNMWLDDDGYFGDGDGSFSDGDLLVAGKDYALGRDQPDGESMSGTVFRLNGVWPRPLARVGNMLHAAPGLAMGNVKVEYMSGFVTIPADIVLATHQMIALMLSSIESGQPLAGENLDYYSYSRFSPDVMSKALGSVESLLKPYKMLVV